MSNYERAYRVQFMQNDLEYEVYVQHVEDSSLLGFVEISDFLPHTALQSRVLTSKGVPLPEGEVPQERKREEILTDVTQMLIPMHGILRIDVLKSSDIEPPSVVDNVHPFPRANTTNHPPKTPE